MRRIIKSRHSMKFTVLAVMMMIAVKVFVVDGLNAYMPDNKKTHAPQQIVQAIMPDVSEISQEHDIAPQKPKFNRDVVYIDFSNLMPQPESIAVERQREELTKEPLPTADSKAETSLLVPEKSALPPKFPGPDARIVIIIDDMGMARQYTQDVIDLQAPLTLAFLPYAQHLSDFTLPAKAKGHELIIHVPMEPMDSSLSLGPAGLTTDLSAEELTRRLDENIFNAFEGYVGINNHMGSKLTQNVPAMRLVMGALKERGLFFVDSKTIGSSVAANIADEFGVPYAERDVFLDHDEGLAAVMRALGKLEETARRKGYAIAIGHPKKNTIAALRQWLPTLAERGLIMVPVSEVLSYPAGSSRAPVSAVSFNPKNLPIIYEDQ